MSECPIDGGKIGFVGGWVLKDGEICNSCGKKVGFVKGDPISNTAAHSYKVVEIGDLIRSGKSFDPDHAKKATQNAVQEAKNNIYQNTEYKKELMDKYGLNDLDPETLKSVKATLEKMSDIGWARVTSTLTSLQDRYQITLNQTQMEQNWILIKQQDETNKLLKQLIKKIN